MKRNDKFVLEKIDNSIYLLPVGQMIAEYNKGIKINETCEFIWQQLEQEISFDDLVGKCAEYFDAEEEDIVNLRKDIETLIRSLKDRGMLEGSQSIFKCSCSLCRNGDPVLSPKYTGFKEDTDDISETVTKCQPEKVGSYVIGGLPVLFYGDDRYFYESFEEFKDKNDYTDDGFNSSSVMKIQVTNIEELFENAENEGEFFDLEGEDADTETSDIDQELRKEKNATVLIHHNELTVLEYPEEYVLFFHSLSGIEELHLLKDGSCARFYCEQPSDEVRLNLFYAIRIAFLIFALNKNRVMLHSCSILFNEKVWAFSAPSGTGKSTHCGIWKKLFDTPVVNGDLNLIGLENGIPYVYGTPWCGTSGIFENRKRTLGGIILLKQSSNNRIEALSEENKILYVQQRLTTSVWDKKMLEQTLGIVSEIVKKIYVKRLYCNMEDEAGYLIHDDIVLSL